jgi:hypothetical protein
MSTIKAKQLQLGDNADATQNFVWQTNNDGTAKLARGNVGATTQDILTVDAAGKVNLKQTLQSYSSVARVSGTTYTNDTNSPIVVIPKITSSVAGNGVLTITVDGVLVWDAVVLANGIGFVSSGYAVVPAGKTYVITASGWTLNNTIELR